MNSNVIPSIDLTGGPWYSKDGALDIEFIDALHRACKNYIKSKVTSALTRPDPARLIKANQV